MLLNFNKACCLILISIWQIGDTTLSKWKALGASHVHQFYVSGGEKTQIRITEHLLLSDERTDTCSTKEGSGRKEGLPFYRKLFTSNSQRGPDREREGGRELLTQDFPPPPSPSSERCEAAVQTWTRWVIQIEISRLHGSAVAVMWDCDAWQSARKHGGFTNYSLALTCIMLQCGLHSQYNNCMYLWMLWNKKHRYVNMPFIVILGENPVWFTSFQFK